MNALKVVMIVLALAILAGCAGVGVQRTCIKDAVKHNQERSENLERMHTEARVTDSCEKIDVSEALTKASLFKEGSYFRCDVADPIDDDEYAYLLDMYMRSLRMMIGSCLR